MAFCNFIPHKRASSWLCCLMSHFEGSETDYRHVHSLKSRTFIFIFKSIVFISKSSGVQAAAVPSLTELLSKGNFALFDHVACLDEEACTWLRGNTTAHCWLSELTIYFKFLISMVSSLLLYKSYYTSCSHSVSKSIFSITAYKCLQLS